MKKIYFMRHAKAVETNSDKDFKRAINDRGKKDIKLIAKALKKHDIAFDLVVSSDAIRCKQTVKELFNEMDIKKDVKYKKRFYTATANYIFEFIQSIDDDIKNVFLVLHNPAITEICEYISDSSIGNMPTCGVFAIEFEGKFSDIKKDEVRVLFFEYPKRYRGK
ncbi:SixA phosphatase family protein [Campylobacter pinnipediorum]|uniref:SixA phosphatase family protein n=1 Tax=Campylobacter pinnipediorum TaxID=1965231 RepID=UPI00084D4E32|nr:histidine phosphatase family protein [Campylobacter pinnipediorum]